MNLTLARVFIDPINAHDQWYLLVVPMVILIAMGYKAVRVSDMKNYWRQVAVFSIQVLGGMVLLTIAFMLVVNFVIPMIAPMPG